MPPIGILGTGRVVGGPARKLALARNGVTLGDVTTARARPRP
ncbi:hypothetical protein [Streptomyces sp. NPDC088725]